jgi:hypothetical protein
MALPSESAPANGLGSDEGQRVNGILYDDATAGSATPGTPTTPTACSTATRRQLQRHARDRARQRRHDQRQVHGSERVAAPPHGEEREPEDPALQAEGRARVLRGFRRHEHLPRSQDRPADGQQGRAPREDAGLSNPIFQDGDLIYDGVIIREVPEISAFVTNVWTSLLTAGASSARVEPVFLCGQQAAVVAWGQMAKPTFRKEDDYGFIKGVGIEMAYGVSKMFKKRDRVLRFRRRSGAKYRFVVKTTVTSNGYIIKVANTTDAFFGFSNIISDDAGGPAKGFIASAASDDTITLNGTTSGGYAGDEVEVEDIAAGVFRVWVMGKATGTEATPFSATV